MTELDLTHRLQNLGSALTGLSVTGICSQTAWPVGAHFVLPMWVTQMAFITSLVGILLRFLAKPVAGVLIVFVPGGVPDTTEEGK